MSLWRSGQDYSDLPFNLWLPIAATSVIILFWFFI